ncbi:hypothetical protein [Streptomyces sp. SudanB182_2057]|uniref:hypothetical protein n=1 Tax=Streptomyces sp. SudanB182_2057 TaxID=3035281 RepID=UPI003F57E5C0
MAWPRELFGLGAEHSGAFVTGATMSNTVGPAIGREGAGERLAVDVSRQGAAAPGPLDVLSGSPHTGVAKAMSVLDPGRDRLRRVPSLPGGLVIVERDAAPARRLGAGVEGLPGLRPPAPVRFDVVCFTLVADPPEERVARPARATVLGSVTGRRYV